MNLKLNQMEKMNFLGFTLLIAEDDLSNFEYLKSTFRDTGITILHAVSGDQAVKLAEEHPEIGLIFMDGMMPVMTGYDAARLIRKFRPELPIVILTAYVSQDSIRDAVMSGCNDYLAKPIGHEELMVTLKKWSSFKS